MSFNQNKFSGGIRVSAVMTSYFRHQKYLKNQGLCCMFLSAILGVDSTLKPGKIQKVATSAGITNQEKHCDYVIHEYSRSIKQKMYRVKELTPPPSLLAGGFWMLEKTGLRNEVAILDSRG